MKVLVQRVKRAGVEVEGKMVAAIAAGLLVFVGVEKGDARPQAEYLAAEDMTELVGTVRNVQRQINP